MRHCLAVDLKDDPASIEEYIAQHRHVWPEVLQSLHDAGVQNMQI
jgi:L-rhamnose mutarotase